VLLGAFRVSILWTVIAALGLITAVVYALVLVQKTFHGENTRGWRLAECTPRESASLGAMVAIIVWLGLHPQPVIDTARASMNALASLPAAKAQQASLR